MPAHLSWPAQELTDFLIEAKRHGYGTADTNRAELASGAHQISYEVEDWLYTDNFVGGNPFTGYEHVAKRLPDGPQKWLPVWGMSYYGSILDDRLTGKELNRLLGKVLENPEPTFPIRGPRMHFLSGFGRYELRADGTLANFTAKEWIGRSTRHKLYRAQFIGGVINAGQVEAIDA
jgi:hypothetical protein